MTAQETARALNVREFTIICTWLDVIHGKNAKRFEVLQVKRTARGALGSIHVRLLNGKIAVVSVAQIKKDYERKMREMRQKNDSSDVA